jgi:hypothetical protein
MKKLLLILLFIFLVPSVVFSLPAFPGAEGFGSDTIGGRSLTGAVFKVDQLGDNAAAEAAGTTFREACVAAGPRTVVFTVSGVIQLESPLNIKNHYITIAGETSPGGVLVAHYPVAIWAHDVIIRNMRFRLGIESFNLSRDGEGEIIWYTLPQYSLKADAAACLSGNSVSSKEAGGFPCAMEGGEDPATTARALSIFGNSTPQWYDTADAYNVVIDHCSFSWGTDEVVLMTSAAHDITFSNNITGEGLLRAGHEEGEHSKNLALSGKYGGVYNISVHHNYLSNSRDRNPYVAVPYESGGGPVAGSRWVDIRNNVVYNVYEGGMKLQNNAAGNFIHNLAKPGPESTSILWALQFYNALAGDLPDTNNLIYSFGNLGTHRTTQADEDQWNVAARWLDEAVTTDYQKSTPYDTTGGTVTTTVMSSAYADSIVSNAGAIRPVRDSIDNRLQTEWNTETGSFIVIAEYPGDYPTFSTPAAPTDTDDDGMPDSWETTFGSNPGVFDANTIVTETGYSYLETYLHFLAGNATATNASINIGAPIDIGGILKIE